MSGWIKIYREISQHWIFQDAEKFKWWIDLLLMASHEDCRVMVKGELASLKRGQLTVSLSFLSARWGRSKEKVLNFLRLLESDHMIERNSDRKSTTITICNYDSYQEVSEQTPTANRPQTRPLSDQSPTEYKNVEEWKEIYKSSTAPAHTCESEYVRKYREEGMWMDTALILHKTPQECESLFDRWVVEYQHNGDTHSSYSDFKKHFVQWARITISKESRNGNNRPDNSRRGRAGVPADISLDF